MSALPWIAAALVGSAAFVLFVARFIRVGAEKEMPAPPLPARLDPRAGQRAEQTARTTFTTLLALAVLVGVGVVQDALGSAGI